jgi:hypothetical protein
MHLMVLLGDEAQAKVHFGLFEVSANLDEAHTVCTEHTIGSKIVLHAPDETPK